MSSFSRLTIVKFSLMYVAIILCWKSSANSFFTSSTHELSATSDRAGWIFRPIFLFQVESCVTRYMFVWNDVFNVSPKTRHNPSLKLSQHKPSFRCMYLISFIFFFLKTEFKFLVSGCMSMITVHNRSTWWSVTHNNCNAEIVQTCQKIKL